MQPSVEFLKKQRRRVHSAAARLGFDVEHLLGQKKARHGGQRRKIVKINGKTCAVRVLSNVYRQRQRRKIFARTLVLLQSLKESDFLIFRIASPGADSFTLVIPSADLREGIFGRGRRAVAHIYVPLAERPDNPVFDFRQYEEAWHLLGGAKRRGA